jgi:hypothetical protein
VAPKEGRLIQFREPRNKAVICGLMYQPPPEQDGIRSIMPPGRGFRISR